MLGHWALGQEPLGGFGGPSGYVLRAETGVYTLAGQDAVLAASITFTAEYGDYQITGQGALLSRGFRLAADYGSYTLSGQDGAGTYAYRLQASAGTYVISGQDINFALDRILTADTAFYTVAGQDIGFVRTFGATGIKHLHRMGNPIGSKSMSLAPIKARTGYLRASAR